MKKIYLFILLVASATMPVVYSADEKPLHPEWRDYSPANLKKVVSQLKTFREAAKSLGKPDSTTRSPMDSRTVIYRVSETTMLVLEGPPLNDLDPNDDLKPIEMATLYRDNDAGLKKVWRLGDYVFKRPGIPSDRF